MGNYIATLLLGGVLSVPQGQVPVVAQSGVGYSTQSAVITMPMSGVRCELTSFMDNGVLRTVNLCR